MGIHPRRLRAATAYSQTQRTVDRQFLFVPDLVIRNLIDAAAVRAQTKHPVHINWFEFSINHEHNGIAAISDTPEHLENLVRFKQTFHRILAESLIAIWHEKVQSSRLRFVSWNVLTSRAWNNSFSMH